MCPRNLIATAALLLTAAAANAQQSSQLWYTGPATAHVNTNVNLSAQLLDAWDLHGLAGQQVDVGVGDRYSLAPSRVNTLNNGSFSYIWRFTRAGRYRVTFKFSGGSGYLDTRITVFINVT